MTMSVHTTHQLRRSASSISTELWSPHELYSAGPQVDVLQPMLAPLEVDAHRFYAYRLSLSLVPFEVLEDYWAPDLGASRCADESVPVVRCTEMWDNGESGVSITGSIAEQCKLSSWFRFSTTLSRRSFVADRSAAHVETLVAALRCTFPHILFPADLKAGASTCVVLSEFIVHHWSRLSAYLPLLYFLFEMQERAFTIFFKQLSTLVQTRKTNDVTAFDVLKPKKSGSLWSWLSSKQKEVELSVRERLEIIEDHKAMLPAGLEKRYMLALAKRDQLRKMQGFCREYVDGLKEGTFTYEALGEGIVAVFGTSSLPSSWHPECFLKNSREGLATAEQMKILLESVGAHNRLFSEQVLPPLLAEISACESEMCIIASSQVDFYDELVMRAKALRESTRLLTAVTSMSTSGESSTRQEGLVNARKVNERLTSELSNCIEQLDAETAHTEAAIKARLKRLCIAFGRVVKSIPASAGEEFSETYLSAVPLPCPGEPTREVLTSHTVQECHGAKERSSPPAYSTDREYSSS